MYVCIHTGFEENHQFEEGALLVPAFRRSAAASTGRTQTMSSKAYLHLKRSRPAAGQLRLSLGFQPYASLLGSRLWGRRHLCTRLLCAHRGEDDRPGELDSTTHQ